MTINRTHSQYVNNGATSVPAQIAGKNKIINGDFGIWQRGTSFTLSASTSTYCADRMLFYYSGTGTNTVTQQVFTPGTAPVAGYEGSYYARFTTAAGATYFSLAQKVEDVRTLSGQTATFSFWAKASTSVGGYMLFRQNFGLGGSVDVDTGGATITLTSNWTRYTFTVNIPSVSGKTIGSGSYLYMIFVQNSGTPSSNVVDTWGWQLEAGSVATPFTTASGSIGGELALCQRYYWRISGSSGTWFSALGSGASTTKVEIPIQNPVPMRIVPTSIDYAFLRALDFVNARINLTNLALYDGTTNSIILEGTVASGLTQYRPYILAFQSGQNAYLGVNAEL